MKKIRNTYQDRKISFKRWTRTPWGVFTSLKVVVHNHCVKISSFKDSLLKQQGTNKSEVSQLYYETDILFDFIDIGVPWDEDCSQQYALFTKIVPIVKVTQEVPTVFFASSLYIPVNKLNDVDRDFFIPNYYETKNY